ncbi:hypothetical protein UWK_00775 [Desulfocapsa sulfexigens DSM 10523]|uniref:EF-hand domain-containing protein n=1 Tax=Desulfocapsa sulfexigens (strain DSM 10523 / SB164P1) TaxID=1167006 RepID=M1P1G3_DESSD|nr:EF-hand domain-containing protein [Desulfocapsa sulfexigens]AGF77353.1 hypothetical protein UWK_00775 [Desulfocapsa sulfexigens DSM 10523]
MNGISGSYSYSFANMQQAQGARQGQGKGAEGRFNKLDADKNGAIDQAELQTMADKMSGMTGQTMNVAEVAKTYDANNDGLMDRGEMESMMREIQEKTGGLRSGAASLQSHAAYQSNAENDSFSTLMDMFGEQEEDPEDYSPVNIQA